MWACLHDMRWDDGWPGGLIASLDRQLLDFERM